MNKFDPQKIKLAKCNLEGGGPRQEKGILYNSSVYTRQDFIYTLCSVPPETSLFPLSSGLWYLVEMGLFLGHLFQINFGRRKIAEGFGVRPSRQKISSWLTLSLGLVGSKVCGGEAPEPVLQDQAEAGKRLS